VEFRPLFLAGHDRSGTTLLRGLLDRHPDMAMPNELVFFTKWPLRDLLLPRGHRALLRRWQSILSLEEQVPADSFAPAFEKGPASPAALLKAALQQQAAARGKARCGEKTPENLAYAPLILRWYPGAQMVILLRDPRAVVSSVHRAFSQRGRQDAGQEAAVWCANYRFALALVRRYPGRVTMVRYEELLREPEAVLRRLGDWTGLGFHSDQLDPEVPVLPFRDQAQPWMKLASGLPAPERAEAWRGELPARDRAVVEAIAGPLMRRLGYEPEGPALPWRERLRCRLRSAVAGWFFHPVRRAFFRSLNRKLKQRGVVLRYFKR
jgi:hypothetical protein